MKLYFSVSCGLMTANEQQYHEPVLVVGCWQEAHNMAFIYIQHAGKFEWLALPVVSCTAIWTIGKKGAPIRRLQGILCRRNDTI